MSSDEGKNVCLKKIDWSKVVLTNKFFVIDID